MVLDASAHPLRNATPATIDLEFIGRQLGGPTNSHTRNSTAFYSEPMGSPAPSYAQFPPATGLFCTCN